MNIITIILAILVLGFIILVHEAGHFCVGRLCRVGIEEFSIGMGPKIVQWEKKGIKYSVRWILLGGYVRFVGEDSDNSDPRAFNNQAVWKRILTVAAGPGMNFVLAFVVAMGMLMGYGLYQVVPQIDSVIENTPAAEAGLQAGDIILSVNGTKLSYDIEGYALMTEEMSKLTQDDVMAMEIDRSGEKLTLESKLYADEDGSLKMGVYIAQARVPMVFFESVSYSGQILKNMMGMMLQSLRDLVFKGEGVDEVSGTVGIVTVTSQVISQGFDSVLNIILVITLNLGIMNLLPLPALDGGRLVFLVVEGILKLFGRGPIPRDKEGMIHALGLLAFLALFVILTYKDIMRLITGG